MVDHINLELLASASETGRRGTRPLRALGTQALISGVGALGAETNSKQ